MSRRVIAVVDDEPGIRTLVGTYLNAAGYDAQEFPNGREFLDGHHPASAELC